jgi:hypothetical protein
MSETQATEEDVLSSPADCYRAFDPTTDDDQFRKRSPLLPIDATDNQRRIADQFTKISFCLVPDDNEPLGYMPDATHAWLAVGSQYFCVTGPPCDTRDDASVFCWMLAKAIERIMYQETVDANMDAAESR